MATQDQNQEKKEQTDSKSSSTSGTKKPEAVKENTENTAAADPGTTSTAPAKKPAAKKGPKKIKGNLDKTYEFNPGEELMVHFRLTNLAAPRINQRADEPRKNVKQLKKMSAVNFVNAFAPQYHANGAFIGITEASDLYCILKNINKTVVMEAYADKIFSATNGKPNDVRAKFIATLVKNKKRLALNGDPSNQLVFIEDILHIPNITNVDTSKIPDKCIPLNQYLDEDEV